MRKLGETRFGVFDRNLIESALARPLSRRNLRKCRHHQTNCHASIRVNQKSPVERRQQTHRNIFDKSFFEKNRFQIGKNRSRNYRNGFSRRIGQMESRRNRKLVASACQKNLKPNSQKILQTLLFNSIQSKGKANASS
jgi:hypothetical protein